MDSEKLLKILRLDFLEETENLLDQSECCLILFERNSKEIHLAEYKRHIHSIKGSSWTIEKMDLSALIHEHENTIKNISYNKITEFVNLQLIFLDFLRSYLDAMKENTESEVIEQISIFIKGAA